MLILKDRATTPPGNWSYRDVDGTELTANTLPDLVARTLEHRIDKGLPTADLWAIVEDGVCRQKGVRCKPANPPSPEGVRQVEAGDLLRFLQTMKGWVQEGQMVDQAEAERRAEICAGCTKNVPYTGCLGCSGIFAILFQLIGDRKTRMDENLQSCAVCGCENKVSVYVPLEILQKASGDLEYPAETNPAIPNSPACWRRK